MKNLIFLPNLSQHLIQQKDQLRKLKYKKTKKRPIKKSPTHNIKISVFT